MVRNSTAFLLIVFAFFLLFGCKSSQHADSSIKGRNSQKKTIKDVSQQTQVEQEVPKGIPPELSQGEQQRLDSSTLVNNLAEQATAHIPENGQIPKMSQVTLDSTLLKRAVSHGTIEAQGFVQNEYGISTSSMQLDSAAYSQVQEHARQEAEKYILEHSGQNITLDSLSYQQVLSQSEDYISKQLEESAYFKELKNTLATNEGILADPESLILAEKARWDEYLNQKALKEKMTAAAKEMVQQYAKEIQSVQSEMSDMKKIYSSVPDSDDLSSAVKRTSLEESSFGKRLFFGGNFNIGKTEPFSLDISPLIGYRINTLFSVGATLSYRAQLKKDNLSFQKGEQTTYGYSVFAAHKVYRQFFGFLEGENKAIMENTETGRLTTWDQSLLLGIGREIGIGSKVSIQVMVLYNFLYNNNSTLYNSPVVFKTGVQF